MRVLIIRLSAIGDTIHTLPVAALLKERIESLKLSWLVEPASSQLLINNPAVDEVLVMPRKRWLESVSQPTKWLGTALDAAGFVSGLRKKEFDAVLDVQGLLKSALCVVASGAPVRVGFAGARELSSLALTHKLDVGDYFSAGRHVIELNLLLAEYFMAVLAGDTVSGDKVGSSCLPPSLGHVSFPLPPSTESSCQRVSGLLSGLEGNLAVLIPGTTWPTKIWSAQQWVQLASMLASKGGYEIVLIGGSAELCVNTGIIADLRRLAPTASVADLTGRTDLIDLITLFRRSDLVIGGDTGPLHLAAATGVPFTVGIFGSTPWRRNGPWGERCHSISLSLSCQPCFSKSCPLGTTACLSELTAERVFSEVQRLSQGRCPKG